ncbi:unnamed protein product [Blepharisma stoltei]|uniref:EF-hand domain-containing protein n=1 Tax=Blepharisma stoltei TaxID=1481888 RepID=A0AAU9KE51_9CILI|nr:unnamed protein product [Blepharisma stoltei]
MMFNWEQISLISNSERTPEFVAGNPKERNLQPQAHISEDTILSPRSDDDFIPKQGFAQFSDHAARHASEYSGSSWRSTPQEFVNSGPAFKNIPKVPSIKLHGEVSSGHLSSRRQYRSRSYSPSPIPSQYIPSRDTSKQPTIASQKTPQHKENSIRIEEDTIRSNKSINSSQSKYNEESPARNLLQRLEIPKYQKNVDSIIQEEKKEESFSIPIGNTRLDLVPGTNPTFTEEEIKEAFDTFDMDANNYISADEIRTIMDTIGEYVTDEEIDEMVRMLDLEGKGQVAFEEFYRMATGQPIGPVGGALPPSPNMVPLEQSTHKAALSTSKSAKSNESAKLSTSKFSKFSQESYRQQSEEKEKSKIKIPKEPSPERRKQSIDEKSAPKVLRRFDIESMKPQLPSHQVESIQSIDSKKIDDDFLPPVRIRSLKDQLTSQRTPAQKPEENVTKSWKIPEESPQEEYKNIIIPTLEDASHEQQSNILISELVHSTLLTPQAVEKLCNMFIVKTGSESGQLPYEKFLELVNAKLPQERWLVDDRVTRRIFSVLDKDSNGAWSIREFVGAISILARPNKDDQYALVFKIFDTDDDDIITKNELTRILKLNTASVKSDEQALKKAQEILRMTGNDEMMNFQDFLRLKEKPVMLLFPLQERASKITKLLA